MEYFRELIDVLKSSDSFPVILSDDMARRCVRVIEHCEEIEKEFNEKLSEELLIKFDNYRTLLHFIVDGIIVDELCNAQLKVIIAKHENSHKNP